MIQNSESSYCGFESRSQAVFHFFLNQHLWLLYRFISACFDLNVYFNSLTLSVATSMLIEPNLGYCINRHGGALSHNVFLAMRDLFSIVLKKKKKKSICRQQFLLNLFCNN